MPDEEAQPVRARIDRQLSMRLRQTIVAMPGARFLYEILVESPGSWLYRRPTISWLSDPALARQLPRAYRLFARYCGAQRHDPIGAEMLLRTIIAFRRRIAADDGTIALKVGDTTVFLDLHDPRFLRIPGELTGLPSVLRLFVRPGDSFIDIGANHGSFSIVAAKLVGRDGLVISIEPQPRLAGLLRRSLAHSDATFEVHQIACGDRSGQVKFYVPRATSGAAGLFDRYSATARHRTIEVAMRRIDDVIDWRRLTGRAFIKLDIEGSEQAFLRGAGQLIRAAAPPMLIEMNPAAMRAAGTSRASLVQALIDLGYERFITPQEPRVQRPLADQAVAIDGDLIVLPASFNS
jgi:FkbM family methyltransferase